MVKNNGTSNEKKFLDITPCKIRVSMIDIYTIFRQDIIIKIEFKLKMYLYMISIILHYMIIILHKAKQKKREISYKND